MNTLTCYCVKYTRYPYDRQSESAVSRERLAQINTRLKNMTMTGKPLQANAAATKQTTEVPRAAPEEAA